MSSETSTENNEHTPSDVTHQDGASLSAPAAETAPAPAGENPPAADPAPEPQKISRRLLAVDTALGACSVAVFDLDADQPLLAYSIELARGHAEALLPMVDQAMRESGTPFDSLARIVTTTGPGSFTGLRVGISAARGFALACHKPAVGVSTLSAFSAPYMTPQETTPIAAVIDALHGNVYFQMAGAGGRMLVSPRIGTIEDAIRALAVGPIKLVGPGANLIASRWPSPMVQPPALVDTRPAPDIVWVARLGATANPETAKPKPLYLKAPDAQPQAMHRLPRK